MPSKWSKGAAREDMYQSVTDRIVTELENGRVPWVKPWKSGAGMTQGAGAMIPSNAISGRQYSGLNIMMLWDSQFERGFESTQWLTFKQAKEAGGHVRKGEKATRVHYWAKVITKKERARAQEEDREPMPIGILKGFSVFNVNQCADLPGFEGVKPPALSELGLSERDAAIIERTGANVKHGGNTAGYHEFGDFIVMPKPDQFKEALGHTRTLLHELTHWTGHKSRLDRLKPGGFGSKNYAKEELVAEMGSAFVCAHLGIEPTLQHSSYIGGWLKALNDDKRCIFRAASLASKAANYLLERISGEDEAAQDEA